MKRSIRPLFAALMLATVTAGLIAPAADAGRRRHVRRVAAFEARIDHDRGGWRRGGDRACASDHAAHRWFDGRLYCAGKDAEGYWLGHARCEDEFGRKLINQPGFVASVLGEGRYERACRDDRSGDWRR